MRLFLSRADDIEVVGEASSGKECIELFEETRPDICVTDIEMPGKNGIEVARAIRRIDEDAKVLILSMHSDEQTLHDAMSTPVNGYLFKDTDKQKILEAIRAIASGQQVFDDSISQAAFHSAKPAAQNITDREMEVLQLVAAGYSSPEIAKKLYISPRTVDTHRNNLMQKLDIHNTASLVRYALQNNLVNTSLAN